LPIRANRECGDAARETTTGSQVSFRRLFRAASIHAWSGGRRESSRAFLLIVGVSVVVIELMRLVDPRGGYPPGDVVGRDPDYFVPGKLLAILLGALASLAALLPAAARHRWTRATSVLVGVLFIAAGAFSYFNHPRYDPGDPRSAPWFWAAILGWLVLIGAALMFVSVFRPKRAAD
jgi:hypothetical protein